jgi:predicted Zn finger-like uncharacterized protein
MIIQCRKCNSNYKINPQKIPPGRSFVRCTKCSEAIPIAREEQNKVTNEHPKRITRCNQCNVKYAIPLSYFKGETIKVHCGKCGHIFQVSKNVTAEKQATSNSSPERVDENRPIESKIMDDEDIELGSLFDDVAEEESSVLKTEQPERLEDDKNRPTKRPQTPTEKYLDATKLDLDDISVPNDTGLETISSDQKHRFFLNPSDKTARSAIFKNTDKEQSSWPEIQDEASFLDDISDELEYESDGTEKRTGEIYTKTRGKLKYPRSKVWKLVIAIILLLILLVSGYWLYRSTSTQSNAGDTADKFSDTGVAMLEPLRGELIDNRRYTKPFFVLNGVVKNNFPPNENINKVTVKGLLYKEHSEQFFTAKNTTAGISLTRSELQKLSKKEIEKKQDKQLKSGSKALKFTSKTLPFQIVFFDIPAKIHKMEARLISYYRGDKKYQM